MTIKRLAITIFVCGLLYGWMVSSNDQYEKAIAEPEWLKDRIAQYEAQQAEDFRYGRSGK